MFGRHLGGIEQSLVDYCEALKNCGNTVSAIVHPDAKIKPLLKKVDIDIRTVRNRGIWDFFAVGTLKKLLKELEPDVIISHGNRAATLLKKTNTNTPIVGVTHNYSLKRLVGLDAVLAITEDLRRCVIKEGQAEKNVYKISNMVRLPKRAPERPPRRNPTIIGTMGRFVAKKGFNVFIEALAKLKNEGVEFEAHIGGSGGEEASLKNQVQHAGLEKHVKFLGWVEDKSRFFKDIDIFCLPSLHEPFGIILLEAFVHNVPVVTTQTEGPSEIVTNSKDALMVKKGDSTMLAHALKQLIKNHRMGDELRKAAYETAKQYDIVKVGEEVNGVLKKVVAS